MTALFLSYVAGLLTTLNPCVLPVLPLVIASAFSKGRLGPVALMGGMVLGFTAIGVTLASAGSVFGLTEPLIRKIGGVAFVLFGLVLLVGMFASRFATIAQPIANAASGLGARTAAMGLPGQFLAGLLLGAVWSPCSGPTLGAAVALAAQADGIWLAVLRMLVFGLGAATILIVLAIGSREIVAKRRDRMIRIANIAKPVAGAALLLVGVLVLTGLDKAVETWALDRMPEWLVNFTTSV